MANLTPLFRDELTSNTQGQLYHLIRFIAVPIESGVTDINIVDSNDSVIFDGITYTKFPVMFNGISITGTGEINKASLTIANPDRMFNSYLKGIRGVRVEVKTVFEKFTDTGETPDPSACISDDFTVDSYVTNETTIVLTIEPVCRFDVRLPRRRFSNSCYFRFKDPETCGYSGDSDYCAKDLKSCRALNNESRFGAFPGIPSATRRITF